MPYRTRSGRLPLALLLVAGLAAGMTVTVAPAHAAVGVTSTTTTSVVANSTTALAGVALSGSSGTIDVTVATDIGTLSITTTTSLTLAYNNAWTGNAYISFTGVEADINMALATLSIAAGDNAGTTATVSLTALPTAPGYVYLPHSQHFYRSVASYGIIWANADTAARASSFLGQTGYLLTMPDATVNAFVSSRLSGGPVMWFGALSSDNFTTQLRTWVWSSGGPRAGGVISYCTRGYNFRVSCDFVNNAGLYSAGWSPNEPNNHNGAETRGSLRFAYIAGWNDSGATYNGNNGYIVEYGDQTVGSSGFTGVVRAASAVSIGQVPDAPTSVTATRGNASAAVAFTAPIDDGGSAITGYTVTGTPNGSATCASSPCTVSGLTNGTAYTFTVRAKNAHGDSTHSAASGAVTPVGVPGAPTAVGATAGNATASVNFAPPTADGASAITGYTVTGTPGGSASCAGSPCTVSGLTNGTAYTFTVRATNSVGDGVESSGSSAVTPSAGTQSNGTPAVPDAPTNVVAAVARDVVTVEWVAPAAAGGAVITGYVVTARRSGQTCRTNTGLTCTFSQLPTGVAESFSVQASSAAGLSALSLGSTAVVPRTVPRPATALTVVPGDRRLTLTFSPPADSGGAPISGYHITIDGGVTWRPYAATGTTRRTVVVPGVRNGAKYRVAVRMVNGVGVGPRSSTTVAVTKQWFSDPLSAATRRELVAVPQLPVRYRGAVIRTRAYAASYYGAAARPTNWLAGRQLQPGQAASLDGDALFVGGSASLTTAARSQLKALVRSLKHVKLVVCEGYNDYSGKGGYAQQLSRARAESVCTALRQYGARVRTMVRGYAGRRPVVVGGRPADRVANRRVIVVVLG